MSNTYIIAEIGNTHEGSVGLAKQFIRAAAECGVDAVKFQTHIFEVESLPNAPNPPYFKDETRKQYFERTAFNLEQYITLKEFAEKECGVDFFSSPFSIEAVDLLLSAGIKTFKIPSGEVSNIPLLEYLADKADWVILSSGMSSWEELDSAVAVLKGKCKLTVLQCTSEYPCLPQNAGLNVMLEIKERYQVPVGFSDHTLGVGVPLAAVVLGASLVEKHFTLSKLMYGSDAKNSTEPHEFKQLVQDIRAVELAISHKINKDEKVNSLKEMKTIFEKSIVSARDLKSGEVITFSDLAYKKPGNGIPASNFKEVIGKRVIIDISKNQKLTWSDLE
jgi:N,N'-diacetyllegionaminate synthase